MKRYAGTHCTDSCDQCKYTGICLDEAELQIEENCKDTKIPAIIAWPDFLDSSLEVMPDFT